MAEVRKKPETVIEDRTLWPALGLFVSIATTNRVPKPFRAVAEQMNLLRRDKACRYAGPSRSSAALQTVIDFLRHEFAMRRVAHVIVAGWNLDHR
jgi:hypothetical protein